MTPPKLLCNLGGVSLPIEDERSPLQILFDEISEDLRRLGEKMLAAQTTAEELENE